MSSSRWIRIGGALAWLGFAMILAGAQVQWPPVYESTRLPQL